MENLTNKKLDMLIEEYDKRLIEIARQLEHMPFNTSSSMLECFVLNKEKETLEKVIGDLVIRVPRVNT